MTRAARAPRSCTRSSRVMSARSLLCSPASSSRRWRRQRPALRSVRRRRRGCVSSWPQLADIMAARFVGGARLFTFGNGGSSTDAASLAELFARPPWGCPLPARSLVDDSAVVTALGNDVGFDLVFSRQLIAHGAPGDIAIGISTSGSSRNVLTAFAEARTRGMITVGLAGYDGGEMAGCARPAALPRRALGQRAPDPGDPGGARLLLVGRRPATIGRRRWLMPSIEKRR